MESCKTEEKKPEISALDMSPEALKAAIKKKDNNIFVFTDGKRRSSDSVDNNDVIEIKHSVSSL